MIAPHECPIPGPAADFAATLAAQLPVIETARLRLRAPRLADFDAWAEIFGGPAGPQLGGPFDRDDAFTDFAATCGLWLLRGHGVWTVEPKVGGEVLGFVLIGFENAVHLGAGGQRKGQAKHGQSNEMTGHGGPLLLCGTTCGVELQGSFQRECLGHRHQPIMILITLRPRPVVLFIPCTDKEFNF